MNLQLAPLESVSCWAFRVLCTKLGADRTYTEMIRASALARNNPSSWSLIDTHGHENCHVQLMATKVKEIHKYFDLLAQKKDFHLQNINGYNLNLGCPSPDVIRNGGGCALLKRCTRVKDLLTALGERTDLPLSVKIRLGMNEHEMQRGVHINLLDALSELEIKNFEEVIVHLKHGREKSLDKVRYNAIPEITEHWNQKLTLNGGYSAHRVPKDCYGVMFARNAIKNPLIFAELTGKKISKDEARAMFATLCAQFTPKKKYLDYLQQKSQLLKN